MSVEITGRYVGNLKTRLVHGPSGAELITAAPLDNAGDGSSFSPTDLAAAALGACMVTILGIVGERDGLDLGELEFRVRKSMASDPRRIAEVAVEIHMPRGLEPATRRKLERAALTCPVHRSLDPEMAKPVRFVYEDGVVTA